MRTRDPVLEAVVNISEGRDDEWLGMLVESTPGCLDLHVDRDHHRSVVTMIGPRGELIDHVLQLSRHVVSALNLGSHEGVHPRIGVVDVVPFVPLGSATMLDAVLARDETARRLGEELELPCFLYGPLEAETIRTLPEIRRGAFTLLQPDTGPLGPHPTGGAVAVGARGLLVAWNLWLVGVTLARAKQLASLVRTERVRTLGLPIGEVTQVSCNLIDPLVATPADVYDEIARHLRGSERIDRCELVGLAPRACLDSIDPRRWASLDLDPSTTIEWRAESAGITLR